MKELHVNFPVWKEISSILPTYYCPLACGYWLYACGDEYFISVNITLPDDITDFETNFKAQATEVGSKDDAFLKGLLFNGVKLIAPRDVNGNPKVVTFPADGLKRNMISPNWCDPTTWWYSAVRCVNEAAETTDPERKTWTLAHSHVIDVYHGKLSGEGDLHEYRVAVSLNGVQLAEVDPHTDAGDYEVNYMLGVVNFLSAVPEGQTPLVTYFYENGSTWVMQPSPTEIWRLKGAECQFSSDVEMRDSMVYEVWAYNPSDLPNKIMVASPDVYKTISDYINDANKAYPAIPALSSSNWRGMTQPVYVFAWDFQTTTDLISSYGMELRVRLEHDTPFGGTLATGTFYYIRLPE